MAAITVSLNLNPLSTHSPKTPRYSYSFMNPRIPTLNSHRSLGLNNSIRARMVNPRNGVVTGAFGDDLYDDHDDEDEDDDDEEEDRSLEFLVRFVENVFRKVSRKARKVVKSVLPVPISTRLVAFAVNGTLILTFLWVLKAFLQVICTLGSVIFSSILLIRGIWTGISYFQENRVYMAEDDQPKSWTNTRPAL